MTPKLILQLAAPHTWPASIMPALLAIAFACAQTGELSLLTAWVLLVIVVLMQSAVNALNDYFDYVKGTDTAADAVEANDAVLVYNDVAPKQALALAIAFLAAAFLLGICCIMRAGWIPLAIALVGAAIVFLYSGGRTPISYLPIGEAASGFVMGALIPLAAYQVLTLQLDPWVLLWSVPTAIGVALIMLTNNTCDIEKDRRAGRRTLPALLGRSRAKGLYRVLLVLWMIAICALVAIFFTRGVVVLPFMILAAHAVVRVLWGCPFTPESRIQAMGQACSANILFGAFYAAAVFASSGLALYAL